MSKALRILALTGLCVGGTLAVATPAQALPGNCRQEPKDTTYYCGPFQANGTAYTPGTCEYERYSAAGAGRIVSGYCSFTQIGTRGYGYYFSIYF
jgi:hypothetical protein